MNPNVYLQFLYISQASSRILTHRILTYRCKNQFQHQIQTISLVIAKESIDGRTDALRKVRDRSVNDDVTYVAAEFVPFFCIIIIISNRTQHINKLTRRTLLAVFKDNLNYSTGAQRKK